MRGSVELFQGAGEHIAADAFTGFDDADVLAGVLDNL